QVLEGAGEVGVAGPRVLQGAALLRLRRLRVGGHHVAPVVVIAVADEQAHRAAEGLAVADPRQHFHRIALDLHAAAAAVSALAALEVGVDGRAVDGQTSWKSLHDHGQGGAVRLAGGEEAQGRDYSAAVTRAESDTARKRFVSTA